MNYKQRPVRSTHVLLVILIISIALFACVPGGGACGGVSKPAGWAGGVVEDNILYTGTMDGEIVAIDAVSGDYIWHFEPSIGEEKNRAFYGDPVIIDDLIYIAGYDGYLYVISKLDGSLWDQPIPIGENKDNVVGGLGYGEGTLLAGSSDGNIYAYDVQDISNIWSFETGSKIWTKPLIAEGQAFFGSLDKTFYALDIKDGSLSWSFETGGAIITPAAKVGKTILFGSFDGIFYALQSESGKELWRFTDSEGWYWGQPVVSETHVYAPSLDGNLYAIDIDSGRLTWKVETDGPIIGSPLIFDDWIIFGSNDGRLRVVSLKTGASQKRCNIGDDIRTSIVKGGEAIYMGISNRSILAINIKANGDPDEKWSYVTKDQSIDLDRAKAC
jgi:outer membrane protein assembly factor BamB